MKIQVLITPHAWLQIGPSVRQRLSREFKLKKSAPPRCVTQNGRTVVESDGHSVEDLAGLNAESMQEWLGFTNVDPDADIHALLGLCAKRAMDEEAAEAEKGRAEAAPDPELAAETPAPAKKAKKNLK